MSTLAAPRTARPAPVVVRWDRVAVVLALVVLLLAGLGTAAQGGPSSAAQRGGAPALVVVQPGDTLWGIAQEHAPAGVATLEYVAAIEGANDVRAGALVPGTPLRLPAP